MALSDYEMLAFDENGRKCPPKLACAKDGIAIEIFKDRIEVEEKGIGFQMYEGNVHIYPFTIEAKRSKTRKGVFLHATMHSIHKGKLVEKSISGIGAAGFLSAPEWLKAKHPRAYGTIRKYLNNDKWTFSHTGFQGESWSLGFVPRGEPALKELKEVAFRMPYPSCKETWIGIDRKIYDEFLDWLSGVDRNLAAKIRKRALIPKIQKMSGFHKMLDSFKKA